MKTNPIKMQKLIAEAIAEEITAGRLKPVDPLLNLRCPRCIYSAKATLSTLRLGRLRCPVHKDVLQTKDERGEVRGRPSGFTAGRMAAVAE